MIESKTWNPSKWTERAIRNCVKRIYKAAERDLHDLCGPHMGNLLFCEMVAELKSQQSKMELHRLGVKTIGSRKGRVSSEKVFGHA